MKGQIISGELGEILIRQKAGEQIELGELLIADGEKGSTQNPTNEKIILQVYDLLYGSQISQENLELISGMQLEEDSSLEFADPTLRNYLLARAKPVLAIKNNTVTLCKSLPGFFSKVRSIQKEDITFLTKPANALYVGKLRSGRNVLDVDIYLPGDKILSHHLFIPATTGRGKSNLTSVMLWDTLGKSYCSMLVLDPHDEYYGRTTLGLKDHLEASKALSYYTPTNPPASACTLKINLQDIKPNHFEGVANWSDPQRQALHAAYARFGKRWIECIIAKDDNDEEFTTSFNDATIMVVRRRLMSILDIRVHEATQLICTGMFDTIAGTTTINDICNDLEKGKTVIIDTSSLSGATEILVGSIIASEALKRYRYYKQKGELEHKPIISIVLEEAPRVLGNDVLQQGTNIFDTIAREGRKFNLGLIAITQLPSALPRSILANMNTKIILGIEMKPERDAIIDSASQDLSMDSRNIASLDKGEAIISSVFTKFAIPVKIPLFKDVVAAHIQNNHNQKQERTYTGITN